FAVRNSPPPPSQGPDRPATAERFSSTCDSLAQTITALLAPGANYPGKTVLPEWVQACALLLVRSYPTGRSSTISSQHGAIKRTNAFLIRGRCPACNLVRSPRRNQCRNSPPRGRTTACATHARHGGRDSGRTKQHGPAGVQHPTGPFSSGASTSAPGRGRALGRAGADSRRGRGGPDELVRPVPQRRQGGPAPLVPERAMRSIRLLGPRPRQQDVAAHNGPDEQQGKGNPQQLAVQKGQRQHQDTKQSHHQPAPDHEPPDDAPFGGIRPDAQAPPGGEHAAQRAEEGDDQPPRHVVHRSSLRRKQGRRAPNRSASVLSIVASFRGRAGGFRLSRSPSARPSPA